MPTPVSVVRDYLTPEATLAVEEAVVIARKRNHAQTTSIHALSAFLSLPNFPLLRDSISRVRSSIYSSRLQLKALELCFNVSLDRIPSIKTPKSKKEDGGGGGGGDEDNEPPISNSFMAAIKRSQATQKRYPENFHLNHQSQNQQTIVKVELQPLILSILDDPVVSRVFSEAGFRNYDIKVSILRPPPTAASRIFSSAPLFLCNFTENDDFSRKGFNFPFSSGFSNHGGLSNSDDEGEFKRIVEVLQNKEQRNPLLVGVSANDVLHSFEEFCGRRGGNDCLPIELIGLRFVSIEKEVAEFMNGNEGLIMSKFQELERCSGPGPGIVISFGDLKGFVDGNRDGSLVVTELMKLLECCNSEKKLWLMGSASSYETYLKLIRKFPSVEKDWDLKLVPITSLRGTNAGVCASRPQSRMESIVPLGGFFSTPSDLRPPVSDDPSISCCSLCNEKYEQEISSILEGGSIVSVSDHYKASFSSWMQPDELSPDKVKVDRVVINAKVAGIQKKWNDICQRLGHTSPSTKAEISRVGSQILPGIVGFPVVENRKDYVHPSPNKSLSECVSPSMVSPKLSAVNHKIPVFEGKGVDIGPNLQHVRPLRSECFHTEGLSSPASSPATAVTTDLGLGTLYASNPMKEPNNHMFQAHRERLQEFSGCAPSRADVVSTNASSTPIRPSSYSNAHLSGRFDPADIKTLWQSIVKRVGRQNEVIYDVSETISHCKTGNGRRRGTSLRGDIWFSFLGPDRVAKKRIAEALAEMVCGSKKNLTVVDLSSEDGMTCSSTIFGSQEVNDYDLRGKTVVDYVAEEISKKPISVVFLENVDKADPVAQDSLIQAIRTGKLHPWNRREVAVNNTIFIATSEVMKDRKKNSWGNEHVKFPEERILRSESWQMQILIGRVPEGTVILKYSSVSVTSRTSVNKRKVMGIDEALKQPEFFERIKKVCKTSSSNYLDLNLPAEEEETEESDAKCLNREESNSASENSETWLEDFFDQVDRNVVFQPFDFDTLADKVLKEMDKTLHDAFDESTKVSLEIDLKVMEQMLAAAWLCDDKAAIEAWVRQVVGRSIIEIRQQYFNDRPAASGSILKLVACEGVPMKEEANIIRLPATIILNRC